MTALPYDAIQNVSALLAVEWKDGSGLPASPGGPFGSWVWYGLSRHAISVAERLLTESSAIRLFQGRMVLVQVSVPVLTGAIQCEISSDDHEFFGVPISDWPESDDPEIVLTPPTLPSMRVLRYPSSLEEPASTWSDFWWRLPGSNSPVLEDFAEIRRAAASISNSSLSTIQPYIASLHDVRNASGKAADEAQSIATLHRFLEQFAVAAAGAEKDDEFLVLDDRIKAALLCLHRCEAFDRDHSMSAAALAKECSPDGPTVTADEIDRRANRLTRLFKQLIDDNLLDSRRGASVGGYFLTLSGRRLVGEAKLRVGHRLHLSLKRFL